MKSRRNFIKAVAASLVATVFLLRNPQKGAAAAETPGLKIPVINYGTRKILKVTPQGKEHFQVIWNAMLVFKKLKVGEERLITLPYIDGINFPDNQRRSLLAIVYRTGADLIVQPYYKIGENVDRPWREHYKRSEMLQEHPFLEL